MPTTEGERQIQEVTSALEAESNDQSSAPRTLFHYTTAEGLIGILETKALWFTHAAYLNDHSEIEYGTELIQQVVAGMQTGLGSGPWKRFLDLVHERTPAVWSLLDCYVACFCQQGDLLSQWRAYGLGSGYCLGFRTEGLLWEYADCVSFRGFKRMIYEPAEQRSLAIRTIERFRPVIEACGSDTTFDEPSADALFNAIMPLILSFKHPAFAEEREWRFIALTWAFTNPTDTVRFLARAGMPVPYMAIASEGGLPVESIRHGPHPEPELVKKYLRMLGTGYGFSPRIEGSDAPLRT